MEVKFRKKGTVKTVWLTERPEISFPEGMDSVDLTAYPVVHITGKHHTLSTSESFVRENNVTVVYEYDWANGWGSGVIFPPSFNSSRIKFYKSEKGKIFDKKKEEEDFVKAKLQKLCDSIESRFLVKARIEPSGPKTTATL